MRATSSRRISEPSTKQERGLTIPEALLVIAILAIFITLYLSQFRRPPPAYRMNCTTNLKQIGLSFQYWALDNGNNFPMQVSVTNGGTKEVVGSGNVSVNFLVMSNELHTPKILWCGEDEKRMPAFSYATNFNDANISYFVGVDAAKASPQMILSGDDNLALGGVSVKRGLLTLVTNSPMSWTSARHKNQGNILMADGSVQGLSTERLRRFVNACGVATNRLAIP